MLAIRLQLLLSCIGRAVRQTDRWHLLQDVLIIWKLLCILTDGFLKCWTSSISGKHSVPCFVGVISRLKRFPFCFSWVNFAQAHEYICRRCTRYSTVPLCRYMGTVRCNWSVYVVDFLGNRTAFPVSFVLSRVVRGTVTFLTFFKATYFTDLSNE